MVLHTKEFWGGVLVGLVCLLFLAWLAVWSIMNTIALGLVFA